MCIRDSPGGQQNGQELENFDREYVAQVEDLHVEGNPAAKGIGNERRAENSDEDKNDGVDGFGAAATDGTRFCGGCLARAQRVGD